MLPLFFPSWGVFLFFVVLCYSPKDAGLDGSALLKQLLNDEMARFRQRGVPVDSNVKLQALFNASARLMEVSTADQAMHLLLSRYGISIYSACMWKSVGSCCPIWHHVIVLFVAREYIQTFAMH